MTLEEYQQTASQTALYPERYKIIYPSLGLCGEAGEVAEKVKKLLRDNDGILSDEKKQEIKKEMGDVLWYLAALSTDLGLSLKDVAQANVDKLLSRKMRGTIKGSGDNR
mgnify:FL=1